MSFEDLGEPNFEEFMAEMAGQVIPLGQFTPKPSDTLLYCAPRWEGRGECATRELEVAKDKTFTQVGQSTHVTHHICRLYDMRRFLCEQDWAGSTGAVLELSNPENKEALLALFKKTFPEMLSEAQLVPVGPALKFATASIENPTSVLTPVPSATPETAASEGAVFFKYRLENIKAPTLQKKDEDTKSEDGGEPEKDNEGDDEKSGIPKEHEYMWRTLVEEPNILYVEPNKLELRRAAAEANGSQPPQHFAMVHPKLVRLALNQRARSLMQSRQILDHQSRLLNRYLQNKYLTEAPEAETKDPEHSEDDEDADRVDEKNERMRQVLANPEAKLLWKHLDSITSNIDRELLLLRSMIVVADHLSAVVTCFQCREVIGVYGDDFAKEHCARQIQALLDVEAYEAQLDKLDAASEIAVTDEEKEVIKAQIHEIEAKMHPLFEQLGDGGYETRSKLEAELGIHSQKSTAKNAKQNSKQNSKASAKVASHQDDDSDVDENALERLLREDDKTSGKGKRSGAGTKRGSKGKKK